MNAKKTPRPGANPGAATNSGTCPIPTDRTLADREDAVECERIAAQIAAIRRARGVPDPPPVRARRAGGTVAVDRVSSVLLRKQSDFDAARRPVEARPTLDLAPDVSRRLRRPPRRKPKRTRHGHRDAYAVHRDARPSVSRFLRRLSSTAAFRSLSRSARELLRVFVLEWGSGVRTRSGLFGFEAWSKDRTIAAALDVTERTVRRLWAEVRAAGLVLTDRSGRFAYRVVVAPAVNVEFEADLRRRSSRAVQDRTSATDRIWKAQKTTEHTRRPETSSASRGRAKSPGDGCSGCPPPRTEGGALLREAGVSWFVADRLGRTHTLDRIREVVRRAARAANPGGWCVSALDRGFKFRRSRT